MSEKFDYVINGEGGGEGGFLHHGVQVEEAWCAGRSYFRNFPQPVSYLIVLLLRNLGGNSI